MHATRLASAADPTVQATQAVAPVALLMVPASHGRQNEAPVTFPYEPAGQGWHVADDAAPTSALNVPARQGSQTMMTWLV